MYFKIQGLPIPSKTHSSGQPNIGDLVKIFQWIFMYQFAENPAQQLDILIIGLVV
jgi:hypothetical protein